MDTAVKIATVFYLHRVKLLFNDPM